MHIPNVGELIWNFNLKIIKRTKENEEITADYFSYSPT